MLRTADEQVETYAALKRQIDNLRWTGVPFYLRLGKHLAKRVTEIVIEFKPAPHTPWGTDDGAENRRVPTCSWSTSRPRKVSSFDLKRSNRDRG